MRLDLNLWVGQWVVMPNHFHAIIGIGKNQYGSKRDSDQCLIGGSDRCNH